jgi:hypothetical protein
MSTRTDTAPIAPDDLVELVEPLRGRPLKIGSQGRVVLTGLPWGLCSVSFGGHLYQVHRRHLARVEHDEHE